MMRDERGLVIAREKEGGRKAKKNHDTKHETVDVVHSRIIRVKD